MKKLSKFQKFRLARIRVLLVGLSIATALPAVAAAPAAVDFNGSWSITGDVQGVAVTETCALKQSADAKITGSCDTSTGKYDVAGTVADGTVTFHHGGKYEGNDLVITWTGKLGMDAATAGTMTGTIYVDVYDATGNFTAKRVAAATSPAPPTTS